MARVKFGTYSVDVPQGWTLSSVILSGPIEATQDDTPFQRNVITTMEVVENDETMRSYAQRQVEGLKQAGVSREGKGLKEVTLAGGMQALIGEQVILGAGGERVRQMQLIVIKDSIAHTMIASQLDGKRFEAVRREFEKMLLSFQ
jgi:hypothetical protein